MISMTGPNCDNSEEATAEETTRETTEPAAQEAIPETSGALSEGVTIPVETDEGAGLPVLLLAGAGIATVLAAVIFLLVKKKSRERSIRIRIGGALRHGRSA